LALASLFPNRFRPRQATFNLQQFSALAELCRFGLVAPVPCMQLLTPPGSWQNPPLLDFPVLRPVYWYLPKLKRQWHGRFFFHSAWPALKKLARRIKPEVLLANWVYPDGWAGVQAASALGLPVVVQALGSDLMIAAQDPARLPLIKHVLARADAVMTVSRPLAQEARRLGAAGEKVVVVPNGVNQRLFRPADKGEARRRLGVPQSGPLALFVGNLVPVKGIETALKALATLPHVTMLIVGQGPLEPKLRLMAQDLGAGEQVIWAGPQDHEHVPGFMAACDVLLLPSLSEGEPNVVLEALACGRPVVASDVGGVGRLIQSGRQGLLVPPGEPQPLADAIARALQQDWHPEELAASVQDRTWGHSASGLLEVIRSTLK
jgi:glycosyltransferase involved in cell wall biosynthesis